MAVIVCANRRTETTMAHAYAPVMGINKLTPETYFLKTISNIFMFKFN